jgi:hypothetical protein
MGTSSSPTPPHFLALVCSRLCRAPGALGLKEALRGEPPAGGPMPWLSCSLLVYLLHCLTPSGMACAHPTALNPVLSSEECTYAHAVDAYTYCISSFDPRLHPVTYCYYNRFQTASRIDRTM